MAIKLENRKVFTGSTTARHFSLFATRVGKLPKKFPAEFFRLLICRHPFSTTYIFSKNSNRSFRCASPHLWNQLLHSSFVSFRQLCIDHTVAPSNSSSTCSPLLPLITHSLFHPRLKTHLFHKSFQHSLLAPTWTAFPTVMLILVLILKDFLRTKFKSLSLPVVQSLTSPIP